MLDRLRTLAVASRAEFILPNLGSLILGLAWGVRSGVALLELLSLVILSFAIINLSSAIGAQINTVSDYEMDLKDERKKRVTDAVDSLGKRSIRTALIAETIATLILVVLFAIVLRKPLLLVMWVVGISLGWVYSAPPVRLKSRSWLAPASLMLVLGLFPVLFAYLTFTSSIQPLFVLATVGLVLTIYGVIIPTEIRDYFGDRAMGIETLTVHLGLVRSSLISMILIAIGGTLTATVFFIELFNGRLPALGLLALAVPVAAAIVLKNIWKLYGLSKEHKRTKRNKSLERRIVDLSADNPKWIMMITQTYSFLSVVLFLSKVL